jgi:hypothetical protein
MGEVRDLTDEEREDREMLTRDELGYGLCSEGGQIAPLPGDCEMCGRFSQQGVDPMIALTVAAVSGGLAVSFLWYCWTWLFS